MTGHPLTTAWVTFCLRMTLAAYLIAAVVSASLTPWASTPVQAPVSHVVPLSAKLATVYPANTLPGASIALPDVPHDETKDEDPTSRCEHVVAKTSTWFTAVAPPGWTARCAVQMPPSFERARGLADLDRRQILIHASDKYVLGDLRATVAHEVGHSLQAHLNDRERDTIARLIEPNAPTTVSWTRIAEAWADSWAATVLDDRTVEQSLGGGPLLSGSQVAALLNG